MEKSDISEQCQDMPEPDYSDDSDEETTRCDDVYTETNYDELKAKYDLVTAELMEFTDQEKDDFLLTYCDDVDIPIPDYDDESTSDDEQEMVTSDNSHLVSEKHLKRDVIATLSPRRWHNPLISSKEYRELQRELKFNLQLGIDILKKKPELIRVFEERQLDRQKRDQAAQKRRSSFDIKMEERAKHIQEDEKIKEEIISDSEDTAIMR